MPKTLRREVVVHSIRRNAATLLDSAPVLVLAAIAGAGSFTHIRDTATEHGQRGPMAWAVAICIDLTCVMAARECQRDKRLGSARRVSWPGVVLAGGILLSLAANLAQAQPTAWGRVTAATPCAAFLVAVSMLERRAGRTAATTEIVPAVPDEDGLRFPVPDEDEPPVLVAVDSSPACPAPALVDFARRVAAEHEDTHGRPITRDTLRARLGVSNQLASDLLHQIRTS
jgi:Protein of unknown function (DUF2637)